MIQLEDYTTGLVERDGIFFSKNKTQISYPEVGNENCFQIEADSFWFNHRNNCITEGILKYCPDAVFFDIGGGNGFVAKGLEDKRIATVLVEPGIQGCLNAKKRNLTNIVCSTLEDAQFRNNTIPAVGLFDVVEHIEHDVAFLSSVHQLMKVDGLIFISVPAFKTLWSNEDVYAGHFRRYTKGQLEEKLKSVGFKIEYSTYIFSVLLPAVFFFRALPSKLGIKKNPNNLQEHIKDHESKKGFVDKILNAVWSFELKRIRGGKIIPFGGSCFLIARKSNK